MKNLEALLSLHFGYDEFLPGQRKVLESLFQGNNAAAVFPTGGGKSLCYQLPALELPGTTLVVSPLIALMKDQIDALARRGHCAVRLDSSLDADQYRAAMEAIGTGKAKLVYVAPERFSNERFRQALVNLDIALFAVDEAHCISEWGHNFRPDYLKLVEAARHCGAQRLLALTATATEKVLADIRTAFEISSQHAVRTSFHRSNLKLLMTPTTCEHRDELLLARLRDRPPGPGIVYVTHQRTADDLAELLGTHQYRVRSYHAGKKAPQRAAVQEWFFAERDPIVVATIAFGMGIDKADIRYVYHYNLPKSLENYSQEVGRAGRDGKPSTCELFACSGDLNALENFVYGDTPSRSSIGAVLAAIFDGDSEVVDLSLYQLSFESDARQLVVRTLLTYLELQGLIEAKTPYYSNYQMHPLVPHDEILERFSGERRAFVDCLFRHAEKRRKWTVLDLDAACAEHGAPRSRAIRALEYFSEKRWVELKVSGVRNRYLIKRRPSSIGALTAELAARFEQREQAELHRLAQVVALVEADACQGALLCGHFAEVLQEPCGACSWCLAREARGLDGDSRKEPRKMTRRTPIKIESDLLLQAQALGQQHPRALGELRARARFLCGITSPRTSRARLFSHSLAGALAEVPFVEVLAALRSEHDDAQM